MCIRDSQNTETEILVGCDNLRKYETIIDLETNQVVFTYDKQKVPIKIIHRNDGVMKMVNSTTLRDRFEYPCEDSPINRESTQTAMVKDPVWEEKMQEIKQFCSNNSQPTMEQITQLMKIYSKPNTLQTKRASTRRNRQNA